MEGIMEELALGIDLGGSKIYAVITDPSNQVIADAKTATTPDAGPEKTVQAMKETAFLPKYVNSSPTRFLSRRTQTKRPPK